MTLRHNALYDLVVYAAPARSWKVATTNLTNSNNKYALYDLMVYAEPDSAIKIFND